MASDSRHPSTTSQVAAQLTIGAAVVSVCSLAVLHVLRPEVAPASTMMSEYAVGAFAWLMAVCFASFALATSCSFVALASHARGVTGRIGLLCLLLAALGLGMAAAFPMDPVSTLPEDYSFSGRMHGVSFMLGVPGEILAVLLLSLTLRKQARWSALPVGTWGALVWLSLVSMVVTLVIAAPQPGVPAQGVFGIFNRGFMLAYAVWLAVVAWPLARGLSVLPAERLDVAAPRT